MVNLHPIGITACAEHPVSPNRIGITACAEHPVSPHRIGITTERTALRYVIVQGARWKPSDWSTMDYKGFSQKKFW